MSGPLLVTGGSGYLGRALLDAAAVDTPVVATHLTTSPRPRANVGWERLDVRDPDACRALVERARPAAIVHTAYVQEGPEAWDTNVTGSANVAAAAARAGTRLVHVSTDLVFDGAKGSPYTEADEPRPITDYGRSKLEAERRVRAAHDTALVVRTSLMVGGTEPGRQEQAVLAAARGDVPEARFFEDELRSPIHVADLARALLELARRPEPTGVLHVAGPQSLSRFDLACLVANAYGLPADKLERGRLADSGLVRPANCTLDSSRARSLLTAPIRALRP